MEFASHVDGGLTSLEVYAHYGSNREQMVELGEFGYMFGDHHSHDTPW